MIQVTRRSHERVYVNPDRIESLEANPDTVLTLVSGEKLMIRETPEEVLARIAEAPVSGARVLRTGAVTAFNRPAAVEPLELAR